MTDQTKSQLDPRLNAFRSDLADAKLKGEIEAPAFVGGVPATIISHFADILIRPDRNSGLQSQILFGHQVQVFERANGWAWVQRSGDGYVGYVREEALGESLESPTHMVKAPRTFLYPKPDLKSPRCGYRSIGSMMLVVDEVITRGTKYLALSTGEYIIASHLIRLEEWEADYVSVAETLQHSPYLWGGDTGFGIDCSGLVFVAMMLSGKVVLRDSDMQSATIGTEIEPERDGLERGDLVFWKGHVGILSDEETLLHANGHTMDVVKESLSGAIGRIGYLYGGPTTFRRP